VGIRRRLFQYLAIAVCSLQIDRFAEPPVALAVEFNDDRPPQNCVDRQSEDGGQGTVRIACSSLIAVVSVDGSLVVQLLISSLIP